MRTFALFSLALLVLNAGCRVKDEIVDSDPIARDDTGEVVDADGDGVPASEDCDDNDPGVYPDAVEVCDGFDNNCDGVVDEGVTITAYADADGDGYGDEETATEVCALAEGQADQAGDCDDSDAAYNPAAAETDCSDPNDYNCDGSVGYADNDGDGYAACEECDDGNPYVNPGAQEVCNDVDDDCDGAIDDADDSLDVTSGATYYADGDGDGYGAPLNTTEACEAPEGYVADNTDCDDGEASVHPGATELCNDVDDDCDGDTDEDDAADASTWYADSDGDSYGDLSATDVSCEQPSGYVGDSSDCDDGDGAVNPGATELCNGLDDDCDGDADEADAADASTWYADSDGDGYGDASSTTLACDEPSDYVSDDTDCDDGDAAVNPGAVEICSGVDDDCDGVTDDLGPSAIRAGDTSSGQSRRYQYSSVASGAGTLQANWSAEANADSFELAVGTTSGDDDVLSWTDVGSGNSATLTGLTLTGAWEGAEYYISVRAVNGTTACDLSASSDAVQIAEAATWTGDVADLRAPDAWGGYTTDWPQSGVDAVYGAHYFEEVDIGASDVVMVQGWGAVDSVASGVSATDAAVTDPADGWIALYANNISVAGVITASGRGYGGGAGGGGGVRGGVRGYGGDAGLGGDGGPGATSYAGGGGGGSPGGQGGVGAYTGGDGNLYGGGSGATGCNGSHGRDGGDGSVGSVGGTGGTASSNSPGAAGVGEFDVGGGRGVSGCDNWSGGGGGGYGAGGSGGTQWAGSTQESGGGGGGGTGGTGGGSSPNGGAGAGPYAGAGGTNSGAYTGTAGTDGGYLGSASNGDTSTDRSLALGSGGGGGSSGYQETGGGGGGAGGGAIHLYAYDSLTVESTGYVLANGAGAGGGGRDNGGSSTSATGGVGAGGGIRLEAQSLTLNTAYPYISATGGDGQTSNGGSIKLFYDSLSGTLPASGAGYIYDAGTSSWDEPE